MFFPAERRGAWLINGLKVLMLPSLQCLLYVVTDCSPLLAIFNTKMLMDIDNDRLLKLKTKMARFNFMVRWQAGSSNAAADTLSRSAMEQPKPDDIIVSDKEDEEKEFVVAALENDDDLNLQDLRERASEDEEYEDVEDLIETGWPNDKQKLLASWPAATAPYF